MKLTAIEHLNQALEKALSKRPAVGGFPVMAEILRQAGLVKNVWQLPSCQSLYISTLGPVVFQGTPLASGMVDVPPFNQESLIQALRTDQAGQSSFPEFLQAAWKAGVVQYEVNFISRNVTYFGCMGERYLEEYPHVKIVS